MDASAHRYMQQPTHSTLKVVTSADARAALFLVECQLMQPVRRRPDDAEKAQIGHGQVFIWLDGAKGETGLERWTDGRSWGPSRCRDDFLIYEEKTGEHRLTKSTYTARRNTHDDPGALWHLIAYYYADETNDLIDMYTHPTYQPYTSRMAPGYFVSNRKDKSRKAKEVPAPVDPSPLSRYDALVASLQTVVSPTSPATQPPFTNSSPYPSSAHTLSSHTLPSPISGGAGRSSSQAQLVAQYESFSLNGSSQRVTPPRSSQPVADRRMAPIQMTSSQQRRHELTPLKTSFGNDNSNSGSNSRELATDPAAHALTRHTAHDPKSFKKVLAADYHRLPPPANGSTHYTGGGGIREHSRGRHERGSGGGEHNGYGYAASSPSSSSSPGLSPTSSGSSPIEVDMEPLPASYQAYVNAERSIPRPASVGATVPVLAPTPVRAYSAASRSPATPHPLGGSQGTPSPVPTSFAYREPYTNTAVAVAVALRGGSPAGAVAVSNAGASSKQFERGGAEMMVIDDTPAAPAPPPRRIEDEKMIQRLSRGLGQFF